MLIHGTNQVIISLILAFCLFYLLYENILYPSTNRNTLMVDVYYVHFLLWIYLKNGRYLKYFNIFNRCCSSEPLHSRCEKHRCRVHPKTMAVICCRPRRWTTAERTEEEATDRDGGRQQREQRRRQQTETVDDSRENRGGGNSYNTFSFTLYILQFQFNLF